MKLNSRHLALATALTFAITWVLGWLLVWLWSGMGIMQHMQHTDAPHHMNGFGSFSLLFIGGLVWSLWGALNAWLIAEIYNRLN